MFGYAHIPQPKAVRFNAFCRDTLNPFLNFHREPPRVYRRLVGLSHATAADS
jgi:hypothetical protein